MISERKSQAHCDRCEQSTIHIQQVEHPSHLLHFFATFFLCGIWLPIWILMTVFPRKHPVICGTCGQRKGTVTAEHKRERKEAIRQARKERVASVANVTASATSATSQGVVAAVRSAWSGGEAGAKRIGPKLVSAARVAGSAAWSQTRDVAAQVDGILLRLSGEDVFMLWFSRILLAALMAVIGVAALWTMIGVIAR